jgi:hypothetical protein
MQSILLEKNRETFFMIRGCLNYLSGACQGLPYERITPSIQ